MEQFPSDVPLKAVEIPVSIRFGDTDPYGVVYFASYFRYCHHGIEEFFRHNGLPPSTILRNREEGFGLPIVGAACDFLRPVWYGEEIRLSVFVMKVGGKAITFGFHFRRPESGELVAKGQATMVSIGSDWHSRPLPDRVRDAATAYSVST